ncbi:endonuclease/exonuclease/phosphatase family protein [Luteolibacter sp. GHJ8]|uniref:Endonuclease/exonuclease/phosphatase family protein n=1 Tax=Luteolibacter rhizosphaerae TaxID=2989719 RepID=A0ABT3FX40_9BACT|nr:endonuclease/exonuclease/phosphatase family protein [Luteolibacter rhizosphaerae]MCW1912160.1 endonuclease/exonuclease/phosphatase family protein [Luteolibacter rhizosphaerae]
MKISRLAALVSLLAMAGASATEVRLMAWNVEWYPGGSPKPEEAAVDTQKKLVTEVVQREKPDILIGQELRNWQVFADLASSVPDLRAVVVSSFRNDQGAGLWPQQVGIASKLPVEATWAEAWKQSADTPPRGFSFAAVNLPAPETGVLLVYAVHLKSNRGGGSPEQDAGNYRMREESAHQLLRHIAEMERATFKGRVRGVVIAGDLNTNHDGQFGDKTLEILSAGGFHNTWNAVPRAERLSWRGSSAYEPTTFDYILTKGLGSGTARLAEAPKGASDHWPVLITFTFGGEAKAAPNE